MFNIALLSIENQETVDEIAPGSVTMSVKSLGAWSVRNSDNAA